MTKNTVNRIDRNLARRLRAARQETGLSTRAVADSLPQRAAISHATLASYEKGTTVPPIDVLAALADIYKRTLNWFLESGDSLSGIRYRNLPSRTCVAEKRRFEALANKWVDAYVKIERHLKIPFPRTATAIADCQKKTFSELADAVRISVGLSPSEPIQNMIEILEAFAIRVLELRTALHIDGIAANRGSGFVIVLNPATSNDRLRMNAAHELAHVLFDDCKDQPGWTEDAIEKRAYSFASTLLLPEPQLRQAFASKSFLGLIEFKERFGISIAAMIYRAEIGGIIRPSTARRLWIEMSSKGWKKREPGFVARNRANRFEKMLDSAIQSKTLNWREAESITGVREADLRIRINEAMGKNEAISTEETEGGETGEERRLVEDEEQGVRIHLFR